MRLWDIRQEGPVLCLEPVDKSKAIPDCWTVGLGNAYNNEERCIIAGYDNGDLKLFDLRQNSLIWDTNLKNGVCSVELDRRDIQMNKLVATTLEGKCHLFDMRTYNVESGYSSLVEARARSTIWKVSHLPQNRDLFVTCGGDGVLALYKYNYPSQRAIKDGEGRPKGVVGTLEMLNNQTLTTQPIVSLDWNPEKPGLACMAALDQTTKVLLVTKLNKY